MADMDEIDDITIELNEEEEPEKEEEVKEEEQEQEKEAVVEEKPSEPSPKPTPSTSSSTPTTPPPTTLSSLILDGGNGNATAMDDFDQQAAEWDALEEVQMEQINYEATQGGGKIKSQDIRAPGHLLTYLQASRYFFEDTDLNDQKEKIVKTSDIDYEGCDSFLNLFACCCCCECCALYSEDLDEIGEQQRDNILALALTPADKDDAVHTRALVTIYRRLTESHMDCARFGSHWQDIGFQDTKPDTDLRSAGMFGVLQLISLYNYDQSLALKTFQLSRDEKQEFPMSVVSLNITRIVIQSLREGRLNVMANKSNAKAENVTSAAHSYNQGVYDVVARFHTAIFFKMFSDWKKNKYTINDFGIYLKELTAAAKRDPEFIIQEWEKGKDAVKTKDDDDLEFVEL